MGVDGKALREPGSDGGPGAGLLDRCLERGTGVVAAGVYNSGILAKAEVPSDANYNYSPPDERTLERARQLTAVCAGHGVELSTAALQFPFRHPAVVNVTAGASRPEQIRESADRMSAKVPDALWQDREGRGLIPARQSHGG